MTSLSPELETAVLDSVRRGTRIRVALMANGVSDETVRRWKRIAASDATHWPGSDSEVQPETKERIVRFVEALSRARAEALTVVVDSLWHNATTVNPKTGHTDTQAARIVASFNPDNHEDFREPVKQVEMQTTTIRHEDRLAAQASLEELDAWSDAAAALPAPLE